MIEEVLEAAFAELNDELGADAALVFAPDTPLIGNDALDSLNLVLLVTAIENGVEERLGVELALTNDEELLSPDGPLRTLGSLRAFLAERTQDPP